VVHGDDELRLMLSLDPATKGGMIDIGLMFNLSQGCALAIHG
jgi:hypothetical protein